MPLYDFECEDCIYYTEIRQSMDDPSIHKCPICGKETLRKVIINPPIMICRGEPNTIGQLMDKNTRNMGKYEIQDKDAQNNISKEPNEKKNLHRRINAMTPEQKVKWIKEGD